MILIWGLIIARIIIVQSNIDTATPEGQITLTRISTITLLIMLTGIIALNLTLYLIV